MIRRLLALVADRVGDLLGPPLPAATGGEPGSTWLAAVIRSDGDGTPTVTRALSEFERQQTA